MARFRPAPQTQLIWRFGLDPTLVYGRMVGETDSIVEFNGLLQRLAAWARATGRNIAEYRQLDQTTGIILTRWIKSDVRYTDAGGIEHQVPRDELAYYSSPAETESGDLLLTRSEHDRVSIVMFRAVDGIIRDLTEGPHDYAVGALPGGDWLMARSGTPSDHGKRGIFRCSMISSGTKPPCRRISADLPLDGLQAAPGGKYFTFSALAPQGLLVRLASPIDGASIDLVHGVTACDARWSGPNTLWFSRREGTQYRWREMDVETHRPTGRVVPGTTGCFDGQPDPSAPVVGRVRLVRHTDSDIRVRRLDLPAR